MKFWHIIGKHGFRCLKGFEQLFNGAPHASIFASLLRLRVVRTTLLSLGHLTSPKHEMNHDYSLREYRKQRVTRRQWKS